MPGDDRIVPQHVERYATTMAVLDGVATRRAVATALDVSDSTADRVIRDLRTAGYVERREEGYGLTLPGRFAMASLTAFVDRMDDIDRVKHVLDPLPADADLAPVVVDGAEVYAASPTAAHTPTAVAEDLTMRAERVSAVVSAVSGAYVETYLDAIRTGLDASLVVGRDHLDRLLGSHREAVEAALATGRVAVREGTSPPPFGLSVVDLPDGRCLKVTLYDRHGVAGLLVNHTPEAVAWGEQFFETRWAAATPLTRDTDETA